MKGELMKARHVVPLPGKATALLAVLFLACLAVIPLAAACGGEEKEATPTPGATPTATVTGTATPAATGTPVVEGPGITDTEIILGADCPLSGASAAV